MNICPVQIGATVYEAQAWSWRDHQVPCPVCYGKLFVILELGNGERVPVECDGCGLGYDGPQGVVNEPCAGSSVTPFAVGGVRLDGETWIVFDANGYGRKWGVEVFATEAEADARRAVLYSEAVVESEYRGISRREYLRKKPTWLVRYHREQIKRAERDLAYHTLKLSDAKARQRVPSAEASHTS